MKQTLQHVLLSAAVLTGFALPAHAFSPVAPGNLNADVKGMAVTLSWEWGNAGQPTFTDSFERDDFGDAWTLKKTYSYNDEAGANWSIYDSVDMEEREIAHDGTRSALLMYAAFGDDENPATYHQDEWLMARPGAGAVYLDFWYWIYPELLEAGEYPEFPDHYYVKISRDNGTTWTNLWDARYEMSNVDAMQPASIFLGEPADENTIVAFNAVSGDEESLYYGWSIDDVRFTTADESAVRELRLNARQSRSGHKSAAAAPAHRKFIPSAAAAEKAPRRISDLAENNAFAYRVYLDDEILEDCLKTRNYTDMTTKSAGTHTYRVAAWSAAEDKEFASASVDVDIDEFVFEKPRNVKAAFTESGEGKYEVIVTWDAPESEVQPDYYTIYLNDKMLGQIETGDELSVGQFGVYKGAYTFAVESCYNFPEGASERVYSSVYPGTVPAPGNLKAQFDGTSVKLEWERPDSDEMTPDHYSVFWGEECVADDVKETSFTHEDCYPGVYTYSVHAEYADGTRSLPALARVETGDFEPFDLWIYQQDFDGAHTPIGWDIEFVDPYDKVKEMYSWRFDNWFDSEIPESAGFSGSFASISGIAAGMNRLEAYLYSPLFIADESTEYATLSFSKYYSDDKPGPMGAAQFLAQISTDNGDTWKDLADLAAVQNGKVNLRIDDIAGQTFRVRWPFLSRNSGYAAIDDVTIMDAAAGIEGISDDATAKTVSIYTLDGMHVEFDGTLSDIDTLPAGVYVVKCNGRVFKRIVK